MLFAGLIVLLLLLPTKSAAGRVAKWHFGVVPTDTVLTHSRFSAIRSRLPILTKLRGGSLRGGSSSEKDSSEKINGRCIGIDLGTTYSCVAVWRNGRVEICPNEQGDRITPSYVAWTSAGQRLIGNAAKNQAALNPSNTVFDIKRLVGRKASDRIVQEDTKLFPFRCVAGTGDKPLIEVEAQPGTKKRFSPEEISGMVGFCLLLFENLW